MENVIGFTKEFIIIERNSLKELETEANELSLSSGVFAQGRSNGIKFVIEWLKERNIYNEKDFHYLH